MLLVKISYKTLKISQDWSWLVLQYHLIIFLPEGYACMGLYYISWDSGMHDGLSAEMSKLYMPCLSKQYVCVCVYAMFLLGHHTWHMHVSCYLRKKKGCI